MNSDLKNKLSMMQWQSGKTKGEHVFTPQQVEIILNEMDSLPNGLVHVLDEDGVVRETITAEAASQRLARQSNTIRALRTVINKIQNTINENN